MIQLKTIRDSDIFPDQSEDEKTPTRHRQAARGVVFDSNSNVALLYVSKNNYYKLPGGGLDEGEDIKTALHREIMEEIGCKVEVTGEIGEIVEFRAQQGLMQISHVYSAKVIGEKGEPNFMEDEIEDGFEVRWMPLEDAIKAVENDNTNDYQGKFIKIRDLTALKAVNYDHTRNN